MNGTIGIGVYREKDYEKILKLSSDRDSMPESWAEWKKTIAKAKKKLAKYDIIALEVPVLPKELKKFCKENNLRINRSSRSAFISSKMAEST